MDWTTTLNALFWIMGVVSGGFLAYGGWLCLLHLAIDRKQPGKAATRERANWPRGARVP